MTIEPRGWRSVCIGLLAVCTMMVGCARSSSSELDFRLIASARPYEPDIPIPTGFELVDRDSEDRSTGVSRLYLRHSYTGKADKYAVRRFYREQMPLARWTMVSAGNVRGVCTLRFEKGNESCEVEIRDVRQGLGKRIDIQVLVSQEQRGSGVADSGAIGNIQ